MSYRYLLITLLILSASYAMEQEGPPPAKVISARHIPGISARRTKELKKFAAYHMDEESFADLINKSFSKYGAKPGSEQFMEDLGSLLRLLYISHEAMKKIIVSNIHNARAEIALEEHNSLLTKMRKESLICDTQKSDKSILACLATHEGMNFAMTHIEAIRELNAQGIPTDPKEIIAAMKKFFTLTSYPSSGLLDAFKALTYSLDGNYMRRAFEKSLAQVVDFIACHAGALNVITNWQKTHRFPSLAKDNLDFFIETQNYITNLLKMDAKEKMQESDPSLVHDRIKYTQQLNALGELYKGVHEQYEKLYNALAIHFLKYTTPGNLKFNLSTPEYIKLYQETLAKSPNILPLLIPNNVTFRDETGKMCVKKGMLFIPKVLTPVLIIKETPGYYPATQALQDYLQTLPPAPVEKESKRIIKRSRRIRRKQPISVCPSPLSSEETSSSEEFVSSFLEEEISAKADDGSSIEYTNDLILIKDPKNESTIYLFKANVPNKITISLPLSYTRNIDDWFINGQEALRKQGYLDDVNKQRYAGTEERQKQMIRYHSFALAIDDLLPELGLQSTTESRLIKGKKDILIVIPGTMQFDDEKEEVGVFTYIINAVTDQCYHRMFTPESFNKQLDDLIENDMITPKITGLYDVYFPPLKAK